MNALVPQKIIVHHTAIAGRGAQFAIVEAEHERRFHAISSLGFYTGYHYLIEKNGTVTQARAETEEGVHTVGHNADSLGIGLAGNFDFEEPTARQRNALVALIAAIRMRHGIGSSNIYAHRFFSQTNCYGLKLPVEWAARQVASYERADAWNAFYGIKAVFESIYEKVLGKQYA